MFYAPSSRVRQRSALLYPTLLMLLIAMLQVVSARAASDPRILQQEGVEAIQKYVDHFRTTGDMTSLVYELRHAKDELVASYNAFLEKHDLADASLSMVKAGEIERMQDHSGAARFYYTKALESARQAHHLAYQAMALTGLARTEVTGPGDTGRAANYLDEALRCASESGERDVLFEALDHAAEVEHKSGNLVAAGEHLDRALAMNGEIKDKGDVLMAYLNRADVYISLGDQCNYKSTFQICYQRFDMARTDYQRALTLAQARGFKYFADRLIPSFLQYVQSRQSTIRAWQTMAEKGSSHFHPKTAGDVLVTTQFAPLPDKRRATEFRILRQEIGRNALTPDLRRQSDRMVLADPNWFYIDGTIEQLDGNSSAALASYQKALGMLDRDRRKLSDQQNVGNFLTDKMELYYAPILLLLDQRQLARAFDLMEQSRSRSMADLLKEREVVLPTGSERELFSELLTLEATIAPKQQQLFGLVATTYPDEQARTTGQDQIARTEAEISQLEAEHQKLELRIAREAPKLKELTGSEPVSLDTAQSSARQEGYDLLYYLVLRNELVVWCITANEVRVLRVFLARSELETKVKSLRESLSPTADFDQQTSRELFLFLVQPVLRSIKSHQIVIVPHGDLNYLPFQVLQDPANGSYLGERFAISYAPSATVLAQLKKRARFASGRLLAVANPDISDAAAEVETISKLYPGRTKAVTNALVRKEDVKVWVAGYDQVHLSVDGHFNGSQPLLSYLQFKPSGDDDGRLTAAEMFALPLAQDSLVVLSACETGRVEATEANEIVGMERALLFAGANNLVLSSWEVNSSATELWMESFYRNAKTTSLAEAARLALVAVKARSEYRHPYFWGPFLLIGK